MAQRAKKTASESPAPLPPTAARARIMSSIRSKGNATTELALAHLLRKNGLHGWRRHYPILGRPDFVFPRERVAVFVDGCFWHACPRCYLPPARNTAFWANKASSNRARDRRVSRKLRGLGWSVLRVWEHELVAGKSPIERIKKKVCSK